MTKNNSQLLFGFCSFFQDGLKAVENLKPSVEKLLTDLTAVRP